MHSRAMLRYTGPILAACVALTSLAACGSGQSNKSGTFYGEPQSIGSGTARAYTTLDNAGNPTEVGIHMSAASLDGLPQEDAVGRHRRIRAWQVRFQTDTHQRVVGWHVYFYRTDDDA